VQQQGTPVRFLEASPALADLERAPGLLLYDIESDPGWPPPPPPGRGGKPTFLHRVPEIKRQADGLLPTTNSRGPASTCRCWAAIEHGGSPLWQPAAPVASIAIRAGPSAPLRAKPNRVALRLAQRPGGKRAGVAGAARPHDRTCTTRVRRHWLMPVSSYGSRPVASWLGFRWGQKGVDGARCLLLVAPVARDGSDAGRGKPSQTC